jgi:hypothetical protein
MRGHAVRMDQAFLCRHIEMPVLLVNTSESAQVSTKRRTCPFTCTAGGFASAIPVLIPCPLAPTVADGGMEWIKRPRSLCHSSVESRVRRAVTFSAITF